jgi:tetratricopeptide (TPR) repeat protein
MAENKSRKALTEFKRALEIRPSPEAHYVIASLYYKLHRDALAIRHLLKAVDMDRNYSEALYLLALLYKRAGENELAQDALNRAGSQAALEGKRRKSLTKRARKSEPLFDCSMFPPNGLITGVDQRLATALTEDALHVVKTIESDRG